MNATDELIDLDFVKNAGLKPTLDTIDQITNGLHGDGDCGPVLVTDPNQVALKRSSLLATLHALHAQKIIVYKFDRAKRISQPKRHQIYKVYIRQVQV